MGSGEAIKPDSNVKVALFWENESLFMAAGKLTACVLYRSLRVPVQMWL